MGKLVLKVVVMEVVTDFIEEVRCKNVMIFWCRIVKSYKIGAKP